MGRDTDIMGLMGIERDGEEEACVCTRRRMGYLIHWAGNASRQESKLRVRGAVLWMIEAITVCIDDFGVGGCQEQYHK